MNNLVQTLYAQGDLAGVRKLAEQVREAMMCRATLFRGNGAVRRRIKSWGVVRGPRNKMTVIG
jgi:hypothetical protein